MNKKTLLALTIGAVLSHNALAQNVSGVVVDKAGKPVSNAKIAVDGSHKTVYADENGKFSIEGVGSGDVKLHVTAKNFNHFNKHFDVPSEGLNDINIVLAPTVFDIVQVSATPLHASIIESALPVNVIADEALRMRQASTIGETLKREVGVHSTYYGPVSSSPIIRGLDGPRVMVTQNGLDAGDVSRVGPDHAIASEASTAQQIEILRGPATLSYGSGAIGGVVNVVDHRVPRSDETKFEFLAEHNTVSEENLASVNLDTATGNLAFHLDAFWRDAEDFKLAGPAELETGEHHEDEHDEHEDEHGDEHAENADRLENSATESNGYTVGASYLLPNDSFIGFSVGRHERTYGIPGHSHGSHGEEGHDEHEGEADEHAAEENVFADMEQDRYQMIANVNFTEGFFNAAHAKFAFTEYMHQEIEGNTVGTTFDNETFEGRLDLYHREYNGYTGTFSVHYKNSDFSAVGEEAFTPPSETNFIAVSLLEEKHYGDFVFQFGARWEHFRVSAADSELDLGSHEEHEDDHHDDHGDEHDDDHADEHDDDHADEHGDEDHLTLVSFDNQRFDPISLSAGVIWNFESGYNVAANASYAQRAPSAAELFSFGPHIGTQSFDIGAMFELHQESEDDYHIDLRTQSVEMETSFNLDLTFRKFEGDLGFVFNVFYNDVDDFYYQRNTGIFVAGGHAHGEGDAHDDHGDEHDDHADEHDDHADEHDDDHADEHGDEHADEHGEEGLPMLIFDQQDAKLYGYEAQLIYQVNEEFKVTAFSDYIRGKLDNGENLPRIPPLRFGAIFNYVTDKYSAELSLTRYTDQDDVGFMETPTDGYTMVDMNFNYYFDTEMGEMSVYLKGHNLTDENARVHSSFLKSRVPLPGRGFSLGIRGGF